MFRAIILLLRLSIYIGVTSVVILYAEFGGEVLLELGLPAEPVIGFVVGAVASVVLASVVFGLPIILLSINANLSEAVGLLKRLQPAPPPSLIGSVLVPAMVESAIDNWASD